MAVLGLIGALIISLDFISELVTFGAVFGFICENIAVIVHYFIKDFKALLEKNALVNPDNVKVTKN